MTDVSAVSIASQMMLVGDDKLLLPNTVVAEIVSFSAYEPHSGDPEWLLGMFPWRGLSLPLLSYEGMCGKVVQGVAAGARIAVLNALGSRPELRFFGIVTGAIPQLLQLDAARVTAAPDSSESSPAVLSRVLVDGESAIIPDLDFVEDRLAAAMGLHTT